MRHSVVQSAHYDGNTAIVEICTKLITFWKDAGSWLTRKERSQYSIDDMFSWRFALLLEADWFQLLKALLAILKQEKKRLSLIGTLNTHRKLLHWSEKKKSKVEELRYQTTQEKNDYFVEFHQTEFKGMYCVNIWKYRFKKLLIYIHYRY